MEVGAGRGGGGVVSVAQPQAHRAVALAFIVPGFALLAGDCVDLNVQGPAFLAVLLIVIGLWLAGVFERSFWIRPMPAEFTPPESSDGWAHASLLFDQDAPDPVAADGR